MLTVLGWVERIVVADGEVRRAPEDVSGRFDDGVGSEGVGCREEQEEKERWKEGGLHDRHDQDDCNGPLIWREAGIKAYAYLN